MCFRIHLSIIDTAWCIFSISVKCESDIGNFRFEINLKFPLNIFLAFIRYKLTPGVESMDDGLHEFVSYYVTIAFDFDMVPYDQRICESESIKLTTDKIFFVLHVC